MIYQLGVKITDTLIKKDDEQGYIVAWKHKQNHNDLGKFDKEMSYGDATKECEKLIAENEEKKAISRPKEPVLSGSNIQFLRSQVYEKGIKKGCQYFHGVTQRLL